MINLISEVKKRPILWSKWDINYKNRRLVDKVWSEVAKLLNKDKEEVKAKWRNLRDQFQRELKVKTSTIENSNISTYNGKWVHFQQLLFLRDIRTPNDMICPYICNENDVSQEETMHEILSHGSPELTNEDSRNPEITSNSQMVNFFQDPLNFECKIEVSDSDETNQLQDNDPQNNQQQNKEREDNDKITTPRPNYSYKKRTRRIKRKKEPEMTLFEKQILEVKKSKLEALLTKEKAKVDDNMDDDLHFMNSLIPYLKKLDPLRKLCIRNEIQSLIIKELQNDTTCSSTQNYKQRKS